MEIRSVFDPAFKPYGRVVEGYPVDGLLAALKTTPLPDAVAYTPREEALHAAADAQAVGEALFGGMPFQLGWCNGHNTRLNCLEYHRDSEFNLGTEAFILLLAKQDEMENGVLDTKEYGRFQSRSWTFRTGERFFSLQLVRFIAGNLAVLLLSVLLINLCTVRLGLGKLTAKLVVTCFTLAVNFLISRLWIFKGQK